MGTKKILITSTNAMAYHFFLPHVQNLLDKGYEVTLACTNLTRYEKLLKSKIDKRVKNIYYVRLSRNPFKFWNYRGVQDLRRVISNEQFDIIWTNEPVMSIATRIAAVEARKKGAKVLYVVHGFHFFNGAHFINWMIYYPIEKAMSLFADVLVTINKEDYKRGQGFYYKKVYYIHGIGLDTKKFKNIVLNKENKRREIGVPEDAIMLLSVGELGKRKNHEVIIKAIQKYNCENIYYIICGEGKLEKYLKKMCYRYGVEKQVVFLGYRKDIAELCNIADIYVFPSKREGLGIGALEGMSAGLPLISSNINGIRDYTENGKTGFSKKPKDVAGFRNSIEILANNRSLRSLMGQYNENVAKSYDIEKSVEELYSIISELVDKNF